MANDTFATDYVHRVYAGGDPEYTRTAVVYAASAIKPGMAIYVEAGYAYPAIASTGLFSGIAQEKAGDDIDAYFAAGEVISYFPAGCGCEVWAMFAATTPTAAVTMYEGQWVALSATAGQLMLFAYTNAAQATDSNWNQVGRIAVETANHASYMRLAPIKLTE